jgi:hypothetical protein
MARKSNNRNAGKTPVHAKKSNPTKVEIDKDLHKELDNNLNEIIEKNEMKDSDYAEIEKEIADEDEVSYKSAKDLYLKAKIVEKSLDKIKTEYEQLKEKTIEQKNQLASEILATEKIKTDLKNQLQKYNSELTEINRLRIEGSWASIIDKKILDQYDEQLKKQEEILINKIAELNQKHTEYIEKSQSLAIEKIKQETEFSERLKLEKYNLEQSFREKFKEKEIELEQLSKKIEEKNSVLERKQKELEYEKQDFNDEKDYLFEKAKKNVAQQINDLNEQLKNLKEKNDALESEVQSLKNELKFLGSYSAKDIITEFRKKESELFKLREQLELSPDVLNIEELKRLQKEKNEWQDKIRELAAQLNEYKTRYENQKLQIGEKEMLEIQKERLELSLKLQKTAFDELKSDVNELTKKSEEKSPFSACSEMDENYSISEIASDYSILESWLEDIQHSIAMVTNERLFYDLNTIRIFTSGLAMSRFTILQGISGTGKTSLPKAFVQALGGSYGIIAVQAGWKDKQDLIGYYNTFEKKYYEGEFLKYLYQAQTPKYKDKPFFIILDEMNLSHPEHYFADLLSLIEETDPNKQILPISDKVKNTPKYMRLDDKGGIGIKIPENVWFIGTANNDETTLQFAAKTYDRANILDMPKNRDQFDIDTSIDLNAMKISNNRLLDFFKKNQKLNQKSHDKAINYLNNSNFKKACNSLNIGWGNRLEKQIKLFLPVFIELGGSATEALDHIISSKILRSLVDAYDLPSKKLKELKDELEINFSKEFNDLPIKSLAIIENVLENQ